MSTSSPNVRSFRLLCRVEADKTLAAPRWLMHEGRHVDAQRVIAALADDTYDGEATLLQTRIIMQTIEQSHQLGVVRKRNLFTNGPTQHFRRMLIGASSQIFQQIGGCNAIIYFAPVVRSSPSRRAKLRG